MDKKLPLSTPRIAYFYASPPALGLSEIDPPTLCIESDNFPKEVAVFLNIAVINLPESGSYSFFTKVLFGDEEVTSASSSGEIIRHKAYISDSGEYAARMVTSERFNAPAPGYYRFRISLYRSELSEPPQNDDDIVHQSECFVAIAGKWGN